MIVIFRLFLAVALMGAVFALRPAEARADSARTVVFAAASLRGALDEVATAYEGPVVLSYGGSAAMARQVAMGAPADLVILANPEWMDWLADQAALADGTRRDLLGNRLVVIAPAGAPDLGAPVDIPDRLGSGRLALGQTDSVPAGIYARAWLLGAGLWPHVADRLAEVESVRAALALVARGEAPLGITYATDALAEPRVRVVHTVDPAGHPPILYPMAQTRDGAGAGFAAFLQGPVAASIFARHGFLPPPGGGT